MTTKTKYSWQLYFWQSNHIEWPTWINGWMDEWMDEIYTSILFKKLPQLMSMQSEATITEKGTKLFIFSNTLRKTKRENFHKKRRIYEFMNLILN